MEQGWVEPRWKPRADSDSAHFRRWGVHSRRERGAAPDCLTPGCPTGTLKPADLNCPLCSSPALPCPLLSISKDCTNWSPSMTLLRSHIQSHSVTTPTDCIPEYLPNPPVSIPAPRACSGCSSLTQMTSLPLVSPSAYPIMLPEDLPKT